MVGWMDDMRFYVLFNSISVKSGRWEIDNERLCAMELRLRCDVKPTLDGYLVVLHLLGQIDSYTSK